MDTSNTSTDTSIGIELSTLLKCSKPSAIICHLNIQSLMLKMDEVREILTDTKPPVILGLSETWVDKSVLDGEVSIPGYSQYRLDRGSRGGSVLVYVPENCRSGRRSDLEDDRIEAIWIELHLRKNTILLCTVYRPPNVDTSVLESLSGMI